MMDGSKGCVYLIRSSESMSLQDKQSSSLLLSHILLISFSITASYLSNTYFQLPTLT